MNSTSRGFGSDNHSGVLPEVLVALGEASVGHAPSYGTDSWTARAVSVVKAHFGACEPFFVFNGTAANVLGLRAVTKSHESVICSEVSHLNVDECGAPELIGGFKLIPIAARHGKVALEDVQKQVVRRGDQHFSQPRVVSVAQPTELGTVYTVEELRALANFAHANGMVLHVDGARLVNAAAALDCSLRELTTDLGVDVVSFGGTKNGLLFGEAVLFLGDTDVQDFRYLRKQCLQLPSKSRFIAAQFERWLSDDLWLRTARHANAMAKRLREAVEDIPGVEITHPVEANAVFARVPQRVIKPLRKHSFFYVWDEHTFEVRWMTTFDTRPEDVDAFAGELRALLESDAT